MSDNGREESAGRSRQAPIDSLEQLARGALVHWRVDAAQLSLLKYRENAVFKVTESGTGDRFVLRLHRPGYHSDAELRSELQWMAALHDAGVETPSAVPTASGYTIVTVRHDAVPEPRQCDLLRWIDGTVVGVIEGGREAAGRALSGMLDGAGAGAPIVQAGQSGCGYALDYDAGGREAWKLIPPTIDGGVPLLRVVDERNGGGACAGWRQPGVGHQRPG